MGLSAHITTIYGPSDCYALKRRASFFTQVTRISFTYCRWGREWTLFLRKPSKNQVAFKRRFSELKNAIFKHRFFKNWLILEANNGHSRLQLQKFSGNHFTFQLRKNCFPSFPTQNNRMSSAWYYMGGNEHYTREILILKTERKF